jgi:broad specificity phosphatase PhoE
VANCLGVEVEVVNRFTEMDFGMLQGQFADREQAFPTFKTNRAIDPLHTSYPGGESYFDLALRVQPDIDRIASVGRTALIVGHGSVNRMLRPFLTSRTIEEAASLHQANDVVVGVNLVTRVESHYLIGG